MSDEVTRRNILAIKSHSEVTRGQLREMQLLVEGYADTLETLRKHVGILESQVQALQVRIFTGGATSGDND